MLFKLVISEHLDRSLNWRELFPASSSKLERLHSCDWHLRLFDQSPTACSTTIQPRSVSNFSSIMTSIQWTLACTVDGPLEPNSSALRQTAWSISFILRTGAKSIRRSSCSHRSSTCSRHTAIGSGRLASLETALRNPLKEVLSSL